ncbi:hypothetical protein DYB32_004262 [Aphanomyces invadans]|uniref:EF-hand domain-containing protein n=1 Tax=Aphanomyces invadans TaxID=157072 RepID=A0A418AY35_9STRA|nr:hypothetical protein DYB32_004262 [Aphanomyces invadans]
MPFINTIFSELTTLGFIGSVLFVMSKSGYLSQDFQLERDTRFPFNEYLTIISGEVMAKLIQIDGITWIALEVCIISLLATCWLVGPDNEVFVFGIAGGFLVLLNQFVYGRIRHMRQLLTPPILFKKAERYRANLAWRAQHNLAPLVPTPPSIPSESVPLLPSEVPALGSGVNLTIPQLQDAQKRLLGGGTGNGVVLALFSTRLVFLFTALHLSVFLLRTLPHLDGLFAFNVEALKAPRVINKVMRIVKARQTLRTLRFIAEMKLYLREHENDHVTSDSTSPDDHAAPTNGQEKAWGGSRGFSLKSKQHRFVMKELPSFHLDDSDWDNMSVLSPRSRMAVEVPMSPMHDPPPFPDTPLGHRSHHPTKDQFAAETERREINSIFSLIDKDKSGKIYTYEMEGFLQQISPDMTSDQIQTIMDDLDKSKSGGVIFDDFEAWCRTHIHEFISIFKSLGQSLDHEDVVRVSRVWLACFNLHMCCRPVGCIVVG